MKLAISEELKVRVPVVTSKLPVVEASATSQMSFLGPLTPVHEYSIGQTYGTISGASVTKTKAGESPEYKYSGGLA